MQRSREETAHLLRHNHQLLNQLETIAIQQHSLRTEVTINLQSRIQTVVSRDNSFMFRTSLCGSASTRRTSSWKNFTLLRHSRNVTATLTTKPCGKSATTNHLPINYVLPSNSRTRSSFARSEAEVNAENLRQDLAQNESLLKDYQGEIQELRRALSESTAVVDRFEKNTPQLPPATCLQHEERLL